MNVTDKSFASFLLQQVPAYDKLILKDIRPLSSLWSVYKLFRRDLRFLTEDRWMFDQIYFKNRKPRMVARQLHCSTRICNNRYWYCLTDIQSRLAQWIKKLPKSRKQKVLKSRQDSRFFEPADSDKSRFEGVLSNLKSDWPPPHKLNCAGEPCDPWTPMRHWDD